MHHWPMLIPQPGDLRRRLLAELESDQIGQFCRLPQRITEPVAFLQEGTVYHSILREIGFKKNLSSRVVRTECARRNGWAGPGFGKKLSWSRENEVWLALSVREE